MGAGGGRGIVRTVITVRRLVRCMGLADLLRTIFSGGVVEVDVYQCSSCGAPLDAAESHCPDCGGARREATEHVPVYWDLD